ncbi:MAG: hypothetical protein EBU66_15660 [Bacteroidetes bacterium]|nr:hypothetical protein [Bacteroidota bacterium]
MKRVWGKVNKQSNKRIKESAGESDSDEDLPSMPLIIQNSIAASHLYHDSNNIYFNNDITDTSCFSLCKELRSVHNKLKLIAVHLNIDVEIPIYLHLTTNGGSIHAAFTVIDCIKNLGRPVYTVIDGYVASAGTLISLAGTKRLIRKNAYTLIHQLSSGVWGKMAEIEDNYSNLKKLTDHLVEYYHTNTKISRKKLKEYLSKDIEWNAEESVANGLVESIYEEDKK